MFTVLGFCLFALIAAAFFPLTPWMMNADSESREYIQNFIMTKLVLAIPIGMLLDGIVFLLMFIALFREA